MNLPGSEVIKRILITLLGFLALAVSVTVMAHESRPLYVEIIEQGTRTFALIWKTPSTVSSLNAPDVRLPGSCEQLRQQRAIVSASGKRVERSYRCSEGLSGQEIEIYYPKFNPSISTLVRIRWASGETRTVLGKPATSRIVIPVPETTANVANDYLVLGTRHILTGYDHLLFLACLLVVARTARRIFWTVSGFTLSHSITLALAALGWISVPVAPVEAVIALSIIFLAREIACDRRDTITWRYPIAVSSSFGYMHGLGFAVVLGEIGLPQTEIVTALLFFNLGVEIGQLLFAGALLFAFLAVRWLVEYLHVEVQTSSQGGWYERPFAYGVGSLASLWFVERVTSLLA